MATIVDRPASGSAASLPDAPEAMGRLAAYVRGWWGLPFPERRALREDPSFGPEEVFSTGRSQAVAVHDLFRLRREWERLEPHLRGVVQALAEWLTPLAADPAAWYRLGVGVGGWLRAHRDELFRTARQHDAEHGPPDPSLPRSERATLRLSGYRPPSLAPLVDAARRVCAGAGSGLFVVRIRPRRHPRPRP